MSYVSYRSLSQKQKIKKIQQAEIAEQHRGPNPLGEDKFPQQNFIQFIVTQNQKKIKLHTYRHKSSSQPKAIIFIFHGLNAHLGQGAHLARCFAKQGYETVGFDHQGFGKSEGQPGYIQSLEQHLQHSRLFIQKVKKLFGQYMRFFGLGISMGGMTVYHLALAQPKLFQSVILMAPALIHNLPSFVPSITNFLTKILPNSTRLLKPFPDRSNRNPVVVEYRKNDPLCFNQRASLKTMNFIVSVMNSSEKTFKQFKCPFLIIQGGIDKLVNPQAAFKLYDTADVAEEDKQLLFYENMWHGIWHQKQIWEIIDECIKWFDKRLGRYGEEKKNRVQLSQQKMIKNQKQTF